MGRISIKCPYCEYDMSLADRITLHEISPCEHLWYAQATESPNRGIPITAYWRSKALDARCQDTADADVVLTAIGEAILCGLKLELSKPVAYKIVEAESPETASVDTLDAAAIFSESVDYLSCAVTGLAKRRPAEPENPFRKTINVLGEDCKVDAVRRAGTDRWTAHGTYKKEFIETPTCSSAQAAWARWESMARIKCM